MSGGCRISVWKRLRAAAGWGLVVGLEAVFAEQTLLYLVC